jgi:isochorismate hydrolase
VPHQRRHARGKEKVTPAIMNRLVRKNQDLHGNAPDSCPVVFLLVDMLNDVDFPGNSQLLKSIRSLGKNISALKKRCKHADIPVIYARNTTQSLRILNAYGDRAAISRLPSLR